MWNISIHVFLLFKRISSQSAYCFAWRYCNCSANYLFASFLYLIKNSNLPARKIISIIFESWSLIIYPIVSIIYSFYDFMALFASLLINNWIKLLKTAFNLQDRCIVFDLQMNLNGFALIWISHAFFIVILLMYDSLIRWYFDVPV